MKICKLLNPKRTTENIISRIIITSPSIRQISNKTEREKVHNIQIHKTHNKPNNNSPQARREGRNNHPDPDQISTTLDRESAQSRDRNSLLAEIQRPAAGLV